jgi:hypothetical protein
MTATAARGVMALAVRCLGDHRREWALAMQAEFDAATEDGHPLRFAMGCLFGALRDLPGHEAGRFVLSSYVLALGLMVPIAASLIFGVLSDFPYAYLMQARADLPAAGGSPALILNEANLAALPSLAVLVVFLGVGHLRLAWDMLECDWDRVAVAARANAAITATLAIFTGVVFYCTTPVLFQAIGVTVELAVISAMTRWYGRLA